MRKLFISTAIIALASAAAPALAQNQNVNNEGAQRNNAAQTTTVTIAPVSVGQTLTGSGLAVGNLVNISAGVGQGFAESAQGNQINNGVQTSTVTAIGGTSATAALSSTSAGNVVNISGTVTSNAGNREMSQINNAAQRASLSVVGGTVNGLLTAGASAIGNSVDSQATSATYIGLGAGNGGGQAFQTNNATQTANLTTSTGTIGSADLRSQATGNSFSANAPLVSVAYTQTNNGGQTSNTTIIGGTNRGNVTAVGSAVGNAVSFTGGASNTPAAGIVQINNATQRASVMTLSTTVDRGSTNAVAVGNTIAFANNTNAALVGSQINNAGQTATNMNLGGTYAGALSFGSQAVGNSIFLEAGLTAGRDEFRATNVAAQTNNGAQNATTFSSGGSFGGLGAISSQAVGNSLSLIGGTATATGVAQINNGPQLASTSVLGGTFNGSLNASATAIGNSTSIVGR